MPKYVEFYYRSGTAISKALIGLTKDLPLKEKAMVNFFVLKSGKYRQLVDADKTISFNEIELLLRDEKIAIAQLVRLAFKMLVNWFFFLFFLAFSFRKRKLYYKNLVKTYVDVEYDLFAQEVESSKSLILIFPFPLSLKRQWNFIKSFGRTRKGTWTLFGLPYNAFLILRLFLQRDLYSAFELEFVAMQNASRILNKLKFEDYLNMDDIEATGVVFSVMSQKKGRNVKTKLHGIGTYSPYVSSDYLSCFNASQVKYYKMFNDIATVDIYQLGIYKAKPLKALQEGLTIIFYSQVTAATKNLQPIEEEVLEVLSRLAEDYPISVLYKPHPNKGGSTDRLLSDLCIRSYEDKNAINYNSSASLSLYSTSFYSAKTKYKGLIYVEQIPIFELFSETEYFLTMEQLRGLKLDD